MEKTLADLITQLGIPAIFLIIMIIALWKPENIKLWTSWIWYFLANILFKSLKQKAVANGVESRCDKAIKSFSKQAPGISMPQINIKWASDTNSEAMLLEGKAIVKLNFTKDHSRNIVTAISEYTKTAILYRTKPYLDKSLSAAIDFTMTKKLLFSIKKYQKVYLSLFLKENPLTDEKVRTKCAILEEIDESGLFTRIVLKELDDFGDKLTGKNPSQSHNEEAHKLINFIHGISVREYDDQTDLLFEGLHINVAIILVAKVETYQKYGITPYLRRIKLSLSKGVEDFYLLARNDKVDILKEAAEKLLTTGHFIQEHKPQEYKDHSKRDSICYYFKINKDSLIAKSLKNIAAAKEAGLTVDGVIIKILPDYIKVEVDGVDGIVYKENISTIPIENILPYFEVGELIELNILRTLPDGTVEFSTKSTKSDPNQLLQEELNIGKEVQGIVRYIDDDFIIVDIPNCKISGIAFRSDLTYSKFIFLKDKFSLGDELPFIVRGYDFVKARVTLELKNLRDPWDDFYIERDQVVKFQVMRKTSSGLIGEIGEGIEAVLYYDQLAWGNDLEAEKAKIKLSSVHECKVRYVDAKRKSVILSRKIGESPVRRYFATNGHSIKNFLVKEVSNYGIEGVIEDKWPIFIPKYLQSWNGKKFAYIIGKQYKVYLQEVHQHGEKLIGSFREVIPHPLAEFSSYIAEGEIVNCNVKSVSVTVIVVEIRYAKRKIQEAVLFNGELTDRCRIHSCTGIFGPGDIIPVKIKAIDKQNNRVIVSLKQLLKSNIHQIQNLKYEDVYNARVLGFSKNGCVVFISDQKIDGILETETKYEVGNTVEVRPLRISGGELLLTDL